MAEVHTWSGTADDNDSSPPDGAPEGMAPSTVNNIIREVMAAIRRKDQDENGTLETGGTSTAYTAAPGRTISALTNGLKLKLKLHITCGAGPTLNVAGLGAVALRAENGAALGAGDLQSNAVVEVVYGVTGVAGWFVQGLRKTGSRYSYVTKSDSDALTLVSNTAYKVTATTPPTLTLPTSPSVGDEILAIAMAGTASFNLQPGSGMEIHWSDFAAAGTHGVPRGFGGATSVYHRAVKVVYSDSNQWLGFVYSSFL